MENQKVKITTAYNVEIEYFTASPWERILAYLIDAAIKVGYLILVSMVIFNGFNIDSYILIMLFFLPFVFYSLAFELFNNGKTVGKLALNLQVVSLTGKNTTTGQYIIRWFCRFLDFGIFTQGLGFISVVSTTQSQRIGDILANTTVITQKEREASRSNLARVKLPKGYTGIFKEVMQLEDHHIQTLKQVVFNVTPAKQKIQLAAAEHIMHLTGIPKTMPAKKYLKMIVYDYNYFQRLEELPPVKTPPPPPLSTTEEE
jgi:uncharacterized RDD family membrane protein YckC